MIESKMCVLICSRIFVRNIFLSKKSSARYHKCTSIDLHVNYLLFCEILIEIEFFGHIFLKILSFMKIRLVGAEMVYSADGRA